MPHASAPEVQQIQVLCAMLMRMPSPTELGHQEKEEDEEREEDTEGHKHLSKEPSITTASQAARTLPVTQGTSSGWPRTEEKTNLGFAAFFK